MRFGGFAWLHGFDWGQHAGTLEAIMVAHADNLAPIVDRGGMKKIPTGVRFQQIVQIVHDTVPVKKRTSAFTCAFRNADNVAKAVDIRGVALEVAGQYAQVNLT